MEGNRVENIMEKFDYQKIWEEEKPFADRLAMWIAARITPEVVVDIGCGPGMHVYSLRDLGVTAIGYDVDDVAEGKKYIEKISMFELKERGVSCDLALCLEVAEHIDEDRNNDIAKACLEILTNRGILIWSAAIPGQGGVNHINCQPKEYWHFMFRSHGAIRLKELEDDMLSYIRSGYHMGWFTQNAMIFIKI